MMRVLSVLIVDDSAVTRAAIRHAIRTSGLAVDVMFEAANGAVALTLLETLRVDVVITDLNMPEMDGYQLLGEIARASGHTSRRSWCQRRRPAASSNSPRWVSRR